MRIFCLILWVFLIPFCAQAGKARVFVNSKLEEVEQVKIVYVQETTSAAAQGDDIRQANLSDYHTIPYCDDLDVDHKNFLNNACAKAAEGAQKYPELAGVQVVSSYFGHDMFDCITVKDSPHENGLSNDLDAVYWEFIGKIHGTTEDLWPRSEQFWQAFLGHHFRTHKQFQDLLNNSACVLPMGPEDIPTLLVFMPVPTFSYADAAPLFNQISFAERADYVFGAYDVLAEDANKDEKGLNDLFIFHDFRMPLHGPNVPYSVSSKSPGLLEILRCSGKDAVRYGIPDPMAMITDGKQNIMRCIQGALSMTESLKSPVCCSAVTMLTLQHKAEGQSLQPTIYTHGPTWSETHRSSTEHGYVFSDISVPNLVLEQSEDGWKPYWPDTRGIHVTFWNQHIMGVFSWGHNLLDTSAGGNCKACQRPKESLPANTCIVLVKDLLDVVHAQPWAPGKPLIWKDFVEAAEKAMPGADIVSILKAADENYAEKKEARSCLLRNALEDVTLVDLPVQRWMNFQAEAATDNPAPENPNPANGAAAAAVAAVPENNPLADALSGWQQAVIQVRASDLRKIIRPFTKNLDAIYDVCPAGSGASIKAVAKRPAKK